jgi:hypothetical protein
MSRTRIRVAAVPLRRSLSRLAFVSLLLGACGSPNQERSRVAEVQREADRRIEAIRAESAKRAAEAQRQIAKLEADLAAKSKQLEVGLRGPPQADAGADDEVANERRSLEERGRAALRRVDQEVRELDARSSSLAKTARTELERELARANASRKAVEDDLDELDRATRQNLQHLSERLERHLAEVEQSLKNARMKLK